jgi:hypothetical protein
MGRRTALADVAADGNTRVGYAPSISNIAAPTTPELNAGILLHSVITPDGLMGFEPETADVDAGALDSTFDTVNIGRDSFSGTGLRMKKQNPTASDTAYNTLTRGTAGFIVIRRDMLASTAWASAQKVEVYPIICGQTKRLSPEANTLSRYEVPVKITSTPELRATIA